ncbi:hypothetical protein SESBI_39440 [Sesbania bispinosa]|nr:hypothetical protein SESBI_39440 [Sesbania bispinosa]
MDAIILLILKEINAILGEKLSTEDEEEILSEFENLETRLTVQDLPEVPTSVSEDINEKLDLPDVPIQAPGEKIAEASTKRKGHYNEGDTFCQQGAQAICIIS